MRYLVQTLIVIMLLTGCKGNFIRIEGNLSGPVEKKIITLEELMSDILVPVDSVPIGSDGSFVFSVEIDHPAFYLLKFDDSNYLTLLLEPGQDIEIISDAGNLNVPESITGSPATKKMVEYNGKLTETINKISELSAIYEENLGSPELFMVMDHLDSLAQEYLEDINSYTKNYIDSNLSSLISLIALYQQVAPGEYILHPEKDLKYYLKVDSSLFEKYPGYDPVLTLHHQVSEVVAQLASQDPSNPEYLIGNTLPEISLPDPTGEIIYLSSTRGKVVLVDFWATWCPPCRTENRNLNRIYDTFNESGFEIFQVSLDRTMEAWTRGIENDNLQRWIHVSDLNYWNSVVVDDYNLESIPFNYLIDEEGKVIAINLRGAGLRQKLEEIFQDQLNN